MSFTDTVAADIHGVFLNLSEFAERRNIVCDGESYWNVPVVMTGIKEKDRRQVASDHVQGLYMATAVLHCALADLGGVQPEKGSYLRISEGERGTFLRRFCVASSVCEMGMLRLELEEVEE